MYHFAYLRHIAVGAIVCAVSACSHPSDKAITSFAESTGAITSITASASDLQMEIDTKTKAMEKAVQFGDYHRKEPTVFPPPGGTYLDAGLKKDWAARVILLKAIGAYAKALAEANDPSLAKSVSETTANLSSALASFQTAYAGRSGSTDAAYLGQRTELIGGIVADATALATEAYTAMVMRDVMSRMQPKLERARDFIQADLIAVVAELKALKIRYRTTLDKKLRLHGSDDRMSSAQRYNAYMNATTEVAALNTKIAIVEESSDAMDAMVKAHKALLESSDDDRAIASFFAVVQSMAEKAKKLQDLEKAHREG
jgi:hypothetical protein